MVSPYLSPSCPIRPMRARIPTGTLFSGSAIGAAGRGDGMAKSRAASGPTPALHTAARLRLGGSAARIAASARESDSILQSPSIPPRLRNRATGTYPIEAPGGINVAGSARRSRWIRAAPFLKEWGLCRFFSISPYLVQLIDRPRRRNGRPGAHWRMGGASPRWDSIYQYSGCGEGP